MFGRDAEHHTRGRVCSPDSRDRAVSRLAEPFAQAGLLRAAKGSLTLRACRKFFWGARPSRVSLFGVPPKRSLAKVGGEFEILGSAGAAFRHSDGVFCRDDV